MCGDRKRVYVGNRLTEMQVIDIFSSVGAIENINCCPKGRPFCFVDFKTCEDAANAIEKVNGRIWGHKEKLRVKWASGREETNEKRRQTSLNDRIKAIEHKLKNLTGPPTPDQKPDGTGRKRAAKIESHGEAKRVKGTGLGITTASRERTRSISSPVSPSKQHSN